MSVKDHALQFIERYFENYRELKCHTCRHLDGKGKDQQCRVLEGKANLTDCPAVSSKEQTHYTAGPKLYP